MALNEYQIVHAINDFVVGCKSDGVWDKITEAYLMAGVNFGGITVKLKERDPLGVIYESDFSAGLDGWWSVRGTVAGNIDGIGGEDDNLRTTVTDASDPLAYRSNTCNVGSTYSISFEYYFPSSNTNTPTAIDLRFSSTKVAEILTPTEDAWGTLSYSGTATNSQIQIRPSNLAIGDVFYIRNVTVTETKAPPLTNNNFVSGDYQATGSGAGLTGDGSSKYLDTGLLGSSSNRLDVHFGAYTTAIGTTGMVMGCRDGSTVVTQLRGAGNDQAWIFNGVSITSGIANTASHDIAVGRASDRELYSNGSGVVTTGSAGTQDGTSQTWAIHRRGDPFEHSDATLTFAHIGTGLTDTDASNLSNRVNTLMTALGCNVY